MGRSYVRVERIPEPPQRYLRFGDVAEWVDAMRQAGADPDSEPIVIPGSRGRLRVISARVDRRAAVEAEHAQRMEELAAQRHGDLLAAPPALTDVWTPPEPQPAPPWPRMTRASDD
jgi:hypothetical protein